MVLVNPHFTLKVKVGQNHTDIFMQMTGQKFDTRYFPATKAILLDTVPTVLQTQCFNDANLPFEVEVQKTEFGHLFEHVLIDLLCAAKSQTNQDCKEISISGVTSWDWNKDGLGTFHIRIDACGSDEKLILETLNKTIPIINSILES